MKNQGPDREITYKYKIKVICLPTGVAFCMAGKSKSPSSARIRVNLDDKRLHCNAKFTATGAYNQLKTYMQSI